MLHRRGDKMPPAMSDSKRLLDRQGRAIDSLRISVTDRCNFRCVYCMSSHAPLWIPRAELLSFEEIERLANILIPLGVHKFRITGGEPLARAGLPRLIEILSSMDWIRDLSLTTNGYYLKDFAGELARAGLKRINVSLDSLDRSTFERMARRDALDRVLRGLEAARRHFPGQVKVNTVILRGENELEAGDFADLARSGCEVRFIEYMPFGAGRSWRFEKLIPGEEIRERIHSVHPLVPIPPRVHVRPPGTTSSPMAPRARSVSSNSVTEPFCNCCNRVRITADGKLKTCLFSSGETDLRKGLRSGARDGEIAEALRAAVWEKEPGHRIGRSDFALAPRRMSRIGG